MRIIKNTPKKYSRGTREMTVHFEKGEATIGLVVSFPEAFPLQLATPQPVNAKGVRSGQRCVL